MYESHPLPGMPGGDPPGAAFGWGLDFGGDEEDPLGYGESSPSRTGVLVGLLVVCGLVVAGLIVVMATRGSDPGGFARSLSQVVVVSGLLG